VKQSNVPQIHKEAPLDAFIAKILVPPRNCYTQEKLIVMKVDILRTEEMNFKI